AMSWRNEWRTEQYLSRESAIASSTASAGTAPRMSNRSEMSTKRRGGCSARAPVTVTCSAVSGWRPLRMISTTSAAMQAASPIAAHCTGEMPALPSPSTTTALPSLNAPKRRSPDHTSSATSGGLASAIRRASARGGGARRLPGLLRGAARQALEREPRRGQQHERVGQRVSERAVGTPRLGRFMNRLAERPDHVLLGHLVHAGNQQLHDEHDQEDGGDLEEQAKVDPMAVARPERGERRGADEAERRPRDQVQRLLQLHQEQRRFHTFTRDHQHGEKEDARKGRRPGAPAGRGETPLDVSLHPPPGAPHVDHHPRDGDGRDDRERPLEQFLV